MKKSFEAKIEKQLEEVRNRYFVDGQCVEPFEWYVGECIEVIKNNLQEPLKSKFDLIAGGTLLKPSSQVNLVMDCISMI